MFAVSPQTRQKMPATLRPCDPATLRPWLYALMQLLFCYATNMRDKPT
jgi:hypothetical protein